MFRSAALRLTGWYLAIIMIISLIFSVSLYYVSSEDLGRNVNRQIGYFNNLIGPDEAGDYGALRQRQLNEDLSHLKANLIVFNLLVLLGGGAASYWLARRTLDPIEEALNIQARFASDASHELRTPLTAIQTENEVALRDKSLSKSQAIGLLKSNLEEIGKLKALSEGLLRLAGRQGGAARGPVSVRDITAAAVQRYLKVADKQQITISDKTSDFNVLGDRDSLTELTAILIDNALKYSHDGSEIVISSFQRGKLGVLEVEDHGIGIKRADLPHIFDRFFRADSSRHKDGADGYGLGLAIAKNIVDAHSGHIEVSSTPGKKTVFKVFLPSS
ncbi:MAG TPA: HAMP domain-containing sensor histidine kinase [Candidatus Saccharimonadales bacterium]|nr:HAMP domain-containing sensor histidine kinase [Candidatus Saccharimonadales bacterium]